MRRREAGRGVAPAGLVATRHPGGIGAPPGTTRSPCQELADATGGGVRSGLLDESGARCWKRPQLARREAPAAICKTDRGHHRFALFGAPSPLSRVEQAARNFVLGDSPPLVMPGALDGRDKPGHDEGRMPEQCETKGAGGLFSW